MKIIKAPDKLFKDLKKFKISGKSIGFVPTMGALHAGHLSLIAQARKENKIVVVSIFVNPKQFGPQEDLKVYPRPLKKDLLLCKKEKVDYVFLPGANALYAEGFSTYVDVEGLSAVLCGKSRPGHFRGVATIVTKLFNLVQPDVAYFGQKDAQQASIIKKMTKDLNFPVKIKIMPTLREKDGLAMSSRNAYLGKQERKDALVLSRALNLAKVLIRGGAKDTVRIISRMKQLISKNKNAKLDYIAIVDSENLKPLKIISGNYLIALALNIKKVRLIDNFQGRFSTQSKSVPNMGTL
ncbi:MAG: pantoate--beta-alanine ligase [Candidatus Omnitrophica bacterium]|nr:pantoate--beta-alanine ligase [Candidatus Omnitrophota bacterium]